jgi:4a-hydroxytetrahydrobiopterin dehydratase
MSDLLQKTCKPCEGGVAALDIEAARALLAQLDEGWGLSDDATEIRREFRFSNYYETLAFVNATAWISHAEDHHPDLEVGYNRCLVRYSTHAIGGLSENDFICAAKVDALLT